jgi:hypothetical protein
VFCRSNFSIVDMHVVAIPRLTGMRCNYSFHWRTPFEGDALQFAVSCGRVEHSSVIAVSSLCHCEVEKCDPLLTFSTVHAYMVLGVFDRLGPVGRWVLLRERVKWTWGLGL